MSLINSKPLFALDTDSGELYHYPTKQYLKAQGHFNDHVGVWDLAKVKRLIETGQSIEAACEVDAPAKVEGEGDQDKVEQANKDFAAKVAATKAADDAAAKAKADAEAKKTDETDQKTEGSQGQS